MVNRYDIMNFLGSRRSNNRAIIPTKVRLKGNIDQKRNTATSPTHQQASKQANAHGGSWGETKVGKNLKTPL